MYKLVLFLLLIATCLSCENNAKHTDPVSPLFKEIPSPAKEGGEPNLFVSKEGDTYLSWVGYVNDTTDALRFSKLKNGQWSPATTIAEGSDWFVNWADFPSMVVLDGQSNQLAAHWLQKSAEGVYDYDVRIAQSSDSGNTWSPSFIPHKDGIAAEHGFLSMLPLENGHVLAVWLDGRNTRGKPEHSTDHAHGGAMTLRTAEFNEQGELFQEAELDGRICDCCQTDAAMTDRGPIVVYRDRSEEEIRDISLVRKVNGVWTEPKSIHHDNWEIAGCPVNGPAIVAQGEFVAIAWFTGAKDVNEVKVVFSNDAGATFSAPIRIDDGQPLGRVDIALQDSDNVVVSWLEEVEDGGEIRMAKVRQTGKVGESITIVKTETSRQSGFPILKTLEDDLLLAWTSIDSLSTVRTMLLSF